jgi:two-component system, OmpR family, sensor histidine kinase ChvG
MAVETDRPLSTSGAREALKRGARRFDVAWRDLARRLRIYEFLTNGPLIRFVTKTLGRRILFSNLIGLLVLVIGIYVLSHQHAWLIDAKRASLKVQGEIIAQAIATNSIVETDRIVLDPDRLPEGEGARVFRDDAMAALELSIHPERVTPFLRRMIQPTDTRARIYGRDGTLIVDSNQLLSRGQVSKSELEDVASDAGSVKLRSSWTKFIAWLMRAQLPVYRELGAANGMNYPEVRQALGGVPTAMLLIDEKGAQIVSQAMPIQRMKAVQGVLLLSTRPGEIDEILWKERSIILTLATMALAATLFASWLLTRTIAGPMRRLSDAAEHVSRNIAARRGLPDLSRRRDEVGQMAVAFRQMTASLYRRIEASERFAADVAHELKNPLTAARSTAESLAYAKTEEKRLELVHQIQSELKRLNKLISDISNASRLEAELALQETQPVDIRQVVSGVASVFNDILASDGRRVVLELADTALGSEAYVVNGHEGRLGQVITNLVDNAISFSPAHGVIALKARRADSAIEIAVEDDGPGIPPDKLDDIFTRFYSDRPQTDRTIGKNSGLGLSISREIVDSLGGQIWAENRAPSDTRVNGAGELNGHRRRSFAMAGARFVVRLPAAGTFGSKGAQLIAHKS